MLRLVQCGQASRTGGPEEESAFLRQRCERLEAALAQTPVLQLDQRERSDEVSARASSWQIGCTDGVWCHVSVL